ncbi:hypothetical protein KKE06_00130 [Candidatus Micrarchaeota archaeon]|nr:hypothetical protein [Candidatus Micrarchaeota archaeon]MBU1931054.1 hypothetical protein [Candidatus Micrarchaeota archaeon]
MAGHPPPKRVWGSTLHQAVKKKGARTGTRISDARLKEWLQAGKIPNVQVHRRGRQTMESIPADQLDTATEQIIALIKREGLISRGFVHIGRARTQIRSRGVLASDRDLISFAQSLQRAGKSLEANGVLERSTPSSPFAFSQKGISNAIQWIRQTEARIKKGRLVALESAVPRTTRAFTPALRDPSLPKTFFRGKWFVTKEQASDLSSRTRKGQVKRQRRERVLSLEEAAKKAAKGGIFLHPKTLQLAIRQGRLKTGIRIVEKPRRRYLVEEAQWDAFLQEIPKSTISAKRAATPTRKTRKIEPLTPQEFEKLGFRFRPEGIAALLKRELENHSEVIPVSHLTSLLGVVT